MGGFTEYYKLNSENNKENKHCNCCNHCKKGEMEIFMHEWN